MASCKECLHLEVCKDRLGTTKYYDNVIAADNVEKLCPNFKDRNRFVELPCEIGNIVYIIPTTENRLKEITKAECINFSFGGASNTANLLICGTSKGYFAGFDKFGKTVFLTREEAEKALKEQK